MEIYRTPESPSGEFKFGGAPDPELHETTANPEAYPGCLVTAMLEANRGSAGAHEAIESTILDSHVDSRGRNLAMACGRCGITLVRDSGVVYGASKCREVRHGQISLGELA